MCLGSLFKSPKSDPLPPPQPLPAPAPVPTPSEISPQVAGDARRRRLDRLRRGAQSTIKTRGITGSGAELASPALSGRSTLG